MTNQLIWWQGVKHSSDDMNIEREARERVAAMLHRNMGTSTEYDFSQASMNTDSFDGKFFFCCKYTVLWLWYV